MVSSRKVSPSAPPRSSARTAGGDCLRAPPDQCGSPSWNGGGGGARHQGGLPAILAGVDSVQGATPCLPLPPPPAIALIMDSMGLPPRPPRPRLWLRSQCLDHLDHLRRVYAARAAVDAQPDGSPSAFAAHGGSCSTEAGEANKTPGRPCTSPPAVPRGLRRLTQQLASVGRVLDALVGRQQAAGKRTRAGLNSPAPAAGSR